MISVKNNPNSSGNYILSFRFTKNVTTCFNYELMY